MSSVRATDLLMTFFSLDFCYCQQSGEEYPYLCLFMHIRTVLQGKMNPQVISAQVPSHASRAIKCSFSRRWLFQFHLFPVFQVTPRHGSEPVPVLASSPSPGMQLSCGVGRWYLSLRGRWHTHGFKEPTFFLQRGSPLYVRLLYHNLRHNFCCEG